MCFFLNLIFWKTLDRYKMVARTRCKARPFLLKDKKYTYTFVFGSRCSSIIIGSKGGEITSAMFFSRRLVYFTATNEPLQKTGKVKLRLRTRCTVYHYHTLKCIEEGSLLGSCMHKLNIGGQWLLYQCRGLFSRFCIFRLISFRQRRYLLMTHLFELRLWVCQCL